jgi:hypothetical protein
VTAPLGVPKVEIYAVSTVTGAGWHDITSRVRPSKDGKTAVKIQHGTHGMLSGIPEPSQCSMRWDCRDGVLWPGNPTSEFAGSLGLNTPLRVPLVLVDHEFPGTAVNDWSDVGGYAVLNTGSGGTVAASDWQQTPGVATHSVPVTSAYRQTVLDGWDMEDCEQQIDFRLPFANTTGGAVEPANLIFRDTGPTGEHWLVRVVVNPDETITVKWRLIQIGVGEFDLTDTVTTSITNSGQWITVKANVEAGRAQTKVWVAGDLEPLEWDNNQDTDTTIENLHTGSIGVRTGVASGNTNTKPIVVEYRNWIIRSIRFDGEISEYPLETDTTGIDISIPIVASGITRRLTQGDQPVLSALRRAIPQQAGLQAYWPLEDPSGSEVFASDLPGHPPMVPLTGTPGYARYSDLPSSQSLPTGALSDWRGVVPDYVNTGNLQISFVLNLPTGGQSDRSILCRWYTEHPSARLWQLIYRTGGDLQLQAWNSESAFVYEATASNFNLDNAGPQLVSVQLGNNGSNVDWAIRSLYFTGGGSALDTGTASGLQIASAKSAWMNLTLLDTPAYGHLFVQSVLTDVFEMADEFRAWNFLDLVNHRMERLLTENGYEFTSIWSNLIANFEMGRQRPGATPALIEECITHDSGGVWFDGRSSAVIFYWNRAALYNQPAWLTLSYADKHLSPPWAPRIDDRDIRNRVTVARVDGSEATYELESGPKSVLPIEEGGVGVYSTKVQVNANDDSYLQQIAAFRVALGTVNEPRYTSAATNLARPELLASPEIGRRLLDLRPGRVFEVADAAAMYQFDSAFQMVAGYTEEITDFIHVFEINGVPSAPYDVFKIEDPQRGRLDSASSTLENGINSSQTTFTVQVADGGALWIDTATHASQFPFDITIGQERMTVTGITTTTPSFVAAGTAAHADNASVTPGLPAGATTGDLLLIYAAVNKADFTAAPVVPAGYTTLVDLAESKVFGKVHSGSESAPTVGITGGAAGVPLSAQMCALRNVPMLVRATAQSFNGGQNIYVPPLNYTISKSIALSLGWKADDWTSVATLTGWTEIGEPSTTLGNDQGLVWDYQSLTGVVRLPENNFVVTGGASASSRSIVLAFGNHQTFTVTRSVNGVVKAHNADAEVHIFRAPRWAL